MELYIHLKQSAAEYLALKPKLLALGFEDLEEKRLTEDIHNEMRIENLRFREFCVMLMENGYKELVDEFYKKLDETLRPWISLKMFLFRMI